MDMEGLQEQDAKPEPVTGERQVPDGSPGVGTFLLNEVVISGTVFGDQPNGDLNEQSNSYISGENLNMGDIPSALDSLGTELESKKEPQGSPTSLDRIISEGIDQSATFSKLADAVGVNPENYQSTVFYNHRINNSGTLPTGQIVLVPKMDPKEVTIELTHEMTNLSNIGKLNENLLGLKTGSKSPEEFAQFLVDVEFEGQINQILVASEIGYRYKGEADQLLNKLIERMESGEIVNLRNELTPNPELYQTYLQKADEILKSRNNK